MSLPLFENLSPVAARVTSATGLLLGLDFDGTLAPLASHPSFAHLSPEMRAILRAFTNQHKVVTALVSGRSLDDLRSRVAIQQFIYAGNHGCEINGSGLEYTDPTALDKRGALSQVSLALTSLLGHIAGTVVEDKGLTISIHYRQVAPALVTEVRRVVESVLAKDTRGFILTYGNKVLEVRPSLEGNKGHAITWIRQRISFRDPLVFYLGDDQTDEDAFRVLKEQITIKVGHSSNTSACYHVDSPACVFKFLTWLEQTCRT